MSPTEKWSEWTSGSGAYQTYSKCWAKIHAYTRIPEEGSMADWLDWMRGAGRYDAEMRTKDLFHLKENEVYINATEFGALALTGRNGTEWRCLPEAMDPRGPKAR
jgi:hypothetical protein